MNDLHMYAIEKLCETLFLRNIILFYVKLNFELNLCSILIDSFMSQKVIYYMYNMLNFTLSHNCFFGWI